MIQTNVSKMSETFVFIRELDIKTFYTNHILDLRQLFFFLIMDASFQTSAVLLCEAKQQIRDSVYFYPTINIDSETGSHEPYLAQRTR